MGYCTRSEYPHRLLILAINSLFFRFVGGFGLTQISLCECFKAHTDLTDLTGFAFEGVKSHRGWWLLECPSALSALSAPSALINKVPTYSPRGEFVEILNFWKFVIICGRLKNTRIPRISRINFFVESVDSV